MTTTETNHDNCPPGRCFNPAGAHECPSIDYAEYGWIIDKDHSYVAGEFPDDAGTMGPRNIHPKLKARLLHPQTTGVRFKIYDDDDELYYSGRIVFLNTLDEIVTVDEEVRPGYARRLVTSGLGDYGFAPLDDFGTPNAGATEIRYKDRQNRWGSL